jgi:hypothetical protein
MSKIANHPALRDIPWDEYLALDRMNPSTLKGGLVDGQVSMKHMQWGIANPKPDTPAMRLGRATHTAILEPERFRDTVCVYDERRGTNKYKEFQANHEGMEILKTAEYGNMIGMAQAIAGDTQAMAMIEGCQPEITICATDHDIKCKGRMDLYRPGLIPDLKTTGQISPRQFGRTAMDFGYLISQGLYRRWVGLETGKKPKVSIISVESKGPYDVIVYPIDENLLDMGEAKGVALLKLYKQCMESGDWPGLAGGELMPLEYPVFGLPENELEGFDDDTQ